MKRIVIDRMALCFLFFFLCAAGVSPSAPMGDDSGAEIVARIAEALGGSESWHQAESIEMSGAFTSLGFEKDFRLVRQRPNNYLFAFYEGSFPITYVYDGEVAWWRRGLMIGVKGDWPAVATLSETRIITLDAEFEPPFLNNIDDKGDLEYLGKVEFDGETVYGFDMHWKNGESESWYVDPETFLPIARVAVLPYNGIPQERMIYYSSYQEVNGLVLPFNVETEFGNVYSVAEVEEIRINGEVDPGEFTLETPGLERLRFMIGEFDVSVESKAPMLRRWLVTEAESTISEDVYGSLLEEKAGLVLADAPFEARRLFSFDRFRERYRMTHFDNTTSHLDVLEGNFDGNRLVMSDVATGTVWESYGKKVNTRFIYHDIGGDGYKLDVEVSEDGGTSWTLDYRMTYLRKGTREE